MTKTGVRAVLFDHYGDRDVLYVAEVRCRRRPPARSSWRYGGGDQSGRGEDPIRRAAGQLSRDVSFRRR